MFLTKIDFIILRKMENSFTRGLKRLFGIKKKRRLAPYGSMVRPVIYTEKIDEPEVQIVSSREEKKVVKNKTSKKKPVSKKKAVKKRIVKKK